MAAVHTTVDSPVGELTVVADDGVLIGLYFPHHWYKPDPATFGPRVDDGFAEARRQLAEYFAGQRRSFRLPVDARGDDFQRRVWQLLDEVPYGQTTTYARPGPPGRRPHARPRRRGGGGPQPDVRDRALPPRARQGRRAHRLRRRAAA
jgi:methylated-DNA-[protein]-cysteine S-methyltransferase